MTAETDIAALDDGGANTAAEVRTALTSVLARADTGVDGELWTEYTPTDQNITVGNGTRTAAYTRVGNHVTMRYFLEFGSTTSFGTYAEFGLPYPAVSIFAGVGPVWALDSGNNYKVGVAINTGLVDRCVVFTNTNSTPWKSDTPHGWNTGDRMLLMFSYEADLS